ncbi:mRNA decay activator protein ZFP36 [Python bivittatus]|uniref:mRNA decay activator protein ZFP36 n=1 Tax=Python bivittatus TaxID=176946 RepID=A0A9F5IK82_PYTBI|nr:mRNA decay activator protein ZFP36 [Python bivittatus]
MSTEEAAWTSSAAIRPKEKTAACRDSTSGCWRWTVFGSSSPLEKNWAPAAVDPAGAGARGPVKQSEAVRLLPPLQNLLNLSLSEELEGQDSTLSCCHSACSSDTALHSSGDSSAVWPVRSHWSPSGEQLRPPLRPDRSVSLIEGKAHLPPPPPGFPPLKQPVPAPSSRYKTELCRTFSESGKCKYGVKCQFAHGSAELRTVSRHPKYKTELCHKFYIHGECPYGSRCHFIHYPEEAQFHSTATTPGASPQLLRQSVSFSGVPTARRTSPLPSLPDPASFARAPSVSPPPASAELFSPAFEHLNVDPLSLMSSLGDSLPAAPGSGCCSCRCGKSAGLASSLQGHRDFFSPAPGGHPGLGPPDTLLLQLPLGPRVLQQLQQPERIRLSRLRSASPRRAGGEPPQAAHLQPAFCLGMREVGRPDGTLQACC